jgi:hypothetical protein
MLLILSPLRARRLQAAVCTGRTGASALATKSVVSTKDRITPRMPVASCKNGQNPLYALGRHGSMKHARYPIAR